MIFWEIQATIGNKSRRWVGTPADLRLLETARYSLFNYPLSIFARTIIGPKYIQRYRSPSLTYPTIKLALTQQLRLNKLRESF
jgi:hypothetical protein